MRGGPPREPSCSKAGRVSSSDRPPGPQRTGAPKEEEGEGEEERRRRRRRGGEERERRRRLWGWGAAGAAVEPQGDEVVDHYDGPNDFGDGVEDCKGFSCAGERHDDVQ